MVITGASVNSLAAEAAYTFAASPNPPSTTLLLRRSITKIQPVIDEIHNINSSMTTSYIPLDLTSNASVRACAEQITSTLSHIDILINSAGTMAPEIYSKSADRIELQLAACHIGHFLLTNLLLPLISPGGRVVTMTSTGYEAGDFRYDDYNFSDGKTYQPWAGYGQAKTANIVFTKELARRTAANGKGVTALVVHPAVVLSTGILRNTSMESMMKEVEGLKAELANEGEDFNMEQPKGIEAGAATMVAASVMPGLETKSGSFMRDSQIVPEEDLKEWVKDESK